MKEKDKKRSQSGATGKGSGLWDFSALVIILLYLGVEFVPKFDSFDVLGPQWIYLNSLNVLSILLLWWEKRAEAAQAVFRSLLTVTMIMLILVMGLSILWAGNQVESLFCYSRYLTTATMFLCISMLIYGRMQIFTYLAYAVVAVLIVQSAQVIDQYFDGLKLGTPLPDVILSLKLNTGNKNILAASLVVKFPFLFYLILTRNYLLRLLFGLALILASVALVLVNARSAFVSFVLITIAYTVHVVLEFIKNKSRGELITQLLLVAIPCFIGVQISNALIRYGIRTGGETEYGTLFNRISASGLANGSTSSRFFQYSSALEYISSDPIMGCGVGNWKLASLPYESDFSNDLYVSYHVHNDFLEIMAETGLIGGGLFLFLFVFCFYHGIKRYFKEQSTQDRILLSTILMALGCYVVDAFLNFPLERPVMQFYFALLLALSGVLILPVLKTWFEIRSKSTVSFFAVGCLLMNAPAEYFHITYYRSLIAQAIYSYDSLKGEPERTWDEVKDAFPPIPNINAFCIPINEIKAKYLMKEKRYEEALQILTSANHNPALGYNEFLRAFIYYNTDKRDSAFQLAKNAFYKRPRSKSYYDLLAKFCIQRKDSATLGEMFRKIVPLRNEDWVWDLYLAGLKEAGGTNENLTSKMSQALVAFPQSELLRNRQKNLYYSEEYRFAVSRGIEFYQKKDYSNAAKAFMQAAALNPFDYSNFENVGLSYYALSDYSNAVPWFEKVFAIRPKVDGKSEYFLGLSYVNLGDRNKGCPFLKVASDLNFSEGSSYYSSLCK